MVGRVLVCVVVDGGVQRLEGLLLPGADVVLDRGGHLADQPVRDVDAVQLAQMPLDLAGRHPARVEGEDLLVEAVEGAGVLGHDPRLERGVAVARQLDRDRPVDRAQRLRRDAVAPVRLRLRRLRTRRVAEMLLQLGAGSPLDQTPTQLVDQPLRAGQLLRPPVLPEQLIDQLVRDLHVAYHGPPSGPPDGIAPTAATPRSSRPRRTNQSDTQKSAHYPSRAIACSGTARLLSRVLGCLTRPFAYARRIWTTPAARSTSPCSSANNSEGRSPVAAGLRARGEGLTR